MSERLEQHGAFLCGNLIQKLDHPPFVLDGHRVELPLAFRRKTHVVSPSIAGNPAPDDLSITDESSRDTAEPAERHTPELPSPGKKPVLAGASAGSV